MKAWPPFIVEKITVSIVQVILTGTIGTVQVDTILIFANLA